jgi:hypothetical protein
MEDFLGQLEFFKKLDEYIGLRVSDKIKSIEIADPYESLDTSEICAALSKAQGSFKPVPSNRSHSYMQTTYADLKAIWDMIREPLAVNELAVTQTIKTGADSSTILITRLRHVSGQWMETRARLKITKDDPTSYGSTEAFYKKQSLVSLLGIAIENDKHDDDGEILMKELRTQQDKGVEINKSYDPAQESFDSVTKEQVEELRYELKGWPDIAKDLLNRLKIETIEDCPKSKYMWSVTKIREIKQLRKGLKED